VLTALFALAASSGRAQVHLRDASDRAAFRAWFVLLADAQFYRRTPDVTDCAALVRHAVREALRPLSAERLRRLSLPAAAIAPEVRQRPAERAGALPLFRLDATDTPRYGEFADARTIVSLNARALGRDARALHPGDLLYFHQDRQRMPDHLMVFVGRSAHEPDGDDWVVYHTGASPGSGSAEPGDPGEVRKVRLADLARHPALHWRPLAENPAFVGVFRLSMM
jgi:uncharacterized protein YfaT (DUF1175 family)